MAGAGRRARWSESGLGAMAGARMGGDHVDGEDGEELEESAQGRAGSGSTEACQGGERQRGAFTIRPDQSPSWC